MKYRRLKEEIKDLRTAMLFDREDNEPAEGTAEEQQYLLTVGALEQAERFLALASIEAEREKGLK